MQPVPLFDALRGEPGPTSLFGITLVGAEAESALEAFRVTATSASQRVEETFGTSNAENVVERLDAVISEMWSTGWDPQHADVNLFARDFGAVLAADLVEYPGAVAVFRSATVLDHFSVYFPRHHLELFPFHKTAKALASPDGESLSQLQRAVVGLG